MPFFGFLGGGGGDCMVHDRANPTRSTVTKTAIIINHLLKSTSILISSFIYFISNGKTDLAAHAFPHLHSK